MFVMLELPERNQQIPLPSSAGDTSFAGPTSLLPWRGSLGLTGSSLSHPALLRASSEAETVVEFHVRRPEAGMWTHLLTCPLLVTTSNAAGTKQKSVARRDLDGGFLCHSY